MDKRQLGFSDLLFKVQVCWSLQESSGVQLGMGLSCRVGFHAMVSPTERHQPRTSTHRHQWLSQWLLPSCSLVFPKISVLVFSVLNLWLVNDPISTTLLTPPVLPFILLWGCSHSCASNQAPGQQAESYQGLQLWHGGKLMEGLWKGNFTCGQDIAQDPFASTVHICKTKGTVFILIHSFIDRGTTPIATLPW